jgi:hypothetical protein
MAVMSEEVVQGVAQEVARCPYCGTITGGTAAALDAAPQRDRYVTET